MAIVNSCSTESEARNLGINVRQYNDKTWTYETYIGLCIKAYEKNDYNDSNFIMIVWDEKSQSPKEVCYGSTRYWSYPSYASYIDANHDIMEKYHDYINQKNKAQSVKIEEIKKALPEIGRVVRVVSGKKHIGKTGIIFWKGANRFRTYNGYNDPESGANQVVGIKTENETFFIPAKQVQVVGCSMRGDEAIDEVRKYD